MRSFVCGLLLLLLAGPLIAASCDSSSLRLEPASPQWNGWGATLANDRYQRKRDARLSVADIPRLELKWAFGYPNASATGGQPSIVGNRVYAGSISGTVYSLDLNTGCTYWTFDAGADVRAAVTIANGAAFFADAAGSVANSAAASSPSTPTPACRCGSPSPYPTPLIQLAATLLERSYTDLPAPEYGHRQQLTSNTIGSMRRPATAIQIRRPRRATQCWHSICAPGVCNGHTRPQPVMHSTSRATCPTKQTVPWRKAPTSTSPPRRFW